MRDVLVIAIVVAFFALTVGYTGWCDRIISGDSLEPRQEPGAPDVAPEPAATNSSSHEVLA